MGQPYLRRCSNTGCYQMVRLHGWCLACALDRDEPMQEQTSLSNRCANRSHLECSGCVCYCHRRERAA